MSLRSAIIILPYRKIWIVIYLPFGMTNITSTDFVTKHTNFTWWETVRETRLNSYRLYIFKKYTFCHAGFCRIINTFSRVLNVNVIIFLLNNCNWQTISINFLCWVCHMISYNMYEKNLTSSINVNVMHHFWKSEILSVSSKIRVSQCHISVCIHNEKSCAC